MCDKYKLDLLATLPLEPAISAICEEGKSLSRERPDAQSTKLLGLAVDSTPRSPELLAKLAVPEKPVQA